ncbi:DoxX family protein [Ornithinimicrobium panacihumi]|uniref:DoxX family protein n=1 Tax=Ornithinimicrobium panacihumi TaxID=2008449 RepID=UPI003F88BCA0
MTGQPREHRTADLDDEAARYHREVYDWDSPDYPEEMHGRGLDFGLLLLRLTSLLLLPHGIAKASDMAAFTRAVDSNVIGAQAPELFAWLVMLGQVALPILLAVGLFTRPAAFLCAAMMSAIWALAVASRLDYTLLSETGGLTGENALLFVALPLALAFTGAGRWSLDSMRTDGRP